MSTRTLYRLGALAGGLSAVCIVIGRLLASLPDTQPGEIFDLLSPFFALFFTVALYLGQRRESGVFGGVAFVVLFTGLAAVVSLDYFGAFIRLQLPEGTTEQIMEGPTGLVVIGSLLTFLVGEILFGVSVMRAGVYSRIAAIPFTAGLVAVPLHPTGLISEGVVDIGAAMAALGMIWWSVGLIRLAGTRSDSA
jgi:hypothetical protein